MTVAQAAPVTVAQAAPVTVAAAVPAAVAGAAALVAQAAAVGLVGLVGPAARVELRPRRRPGCPATRVQTVKGADLLATLQCDDPALCPFPNLSAPTSGSTGRAKPDILYRDNCMITDLTVKVSGTIVDDPQLVTPGSGDLSGTGLLAEWSWAFSGALGGSPIPIALTDTNPGALAGPDIGNSEGCDVQFDDSFTTVFPGAGGQPFAGQYLAADSIATQLVAVNAAQANSDIVVFLAPNVAPPTGDILLIDCIGVTATLVQM